MERLTDHEVAFIERELERMGMPDDGLRRELLDHLCCQVEEMRAGGKDFSTAVTEALSAFGPEGVHGTRRATIRTVRRPSRIRKLLTVSSLTVAATVALAWLSLANTPPRMSPVPAFTAQNVRYLGGPNSCAEFVAPDGTPVLASADGEVIMATETDTALGRVIIIRHDSVHTTVYANLAGLDVQPGMQVHKGEVIGCTGVAAATGESMLHFEVLRFGQPVDPEGFLQESMVM